MIPSKSHPRWEALVKGEVKPNFRVFSGNMMLNQLARSINADDSSSNIQHCINQAYDYFSRFETLLIDELKEIFES